MDNQRIEIKSSRMKNLLGLLVCLVFVMGSLFMITFEVNDNLFNRVLKNSIGYSGVLFFGGGVLISLFKGFTSSPGTDN